MSVRLRAHAERHACVAQPGSRCRDEKVRIRSATAVTTTLLLTVVTGCSDSDEDRAAGLVQQSCKVLYAPIPGVEQPETGMHDPDPEELKLEVAQVKQATEKAMKAATLDDKWFEFSVGISGLYDGERIFLQRVEAGIPRVPRWMTQQEQQAGQLDIVDATCDAALGRDD